MGESAWWCLSRGKARSLSQRGVGTKVAKVRGRLADGVTVDCEPSVENGNVEEWLGLCYCVEWVGEVVNVKGEWRSM